MERPHACAGCEVEMDTKPSMFDEEAYKKGLLGPVIRFGKTVSEHYRGWSQKQYQDLGDSHGTCKSNTSVSSWHGRST